MALICGYQRRNLTKDITIVDARGEVISPDENHDAVRAIVGREGSIGADLSGAMLVVSSELPTVNGSSFLMNYPSSGKNRLRLAALDLAAVPAGTYTLFIDYRDSNDGNEWKNVSRQVFYLEPT